MSFATEASLLLAATIGILLLAHRLLLGRYHKAPAPPGDGGPRQASPRRGLTGPASGRRGPSTPLLCKTCQRYPWNRGPELLCDACQDRYLDALDEFSRGQMDGIW